MNETVKNPSDAFLEAKPRLNEVTEEYLTIKEVAARLKLKPKTIQNRMTAGIFKERIHYVRPRGSRPRFIWRAVVMWMEQGEESTPQEEDNSIPMRRGYRLSNNIKKISGLT
jgi:hypothetical protein